MLFSNGIDQGSKESLRTAIDTAQKTGTIIYAVYVKGEIDKAQKKLDQEHDPNRARSWDIRAADIPVVATRAVIRAEAIPEAVTRAAIGYPGGYPDPYPGGGYPNSGQRRPQQSVKGDGKRVLEDIATPTGGRVSNSRRRRMPRPSTP